MILTNLRSFHHQLTGVDIQDWQSPTPPLWLVALITTAVAHLIRRLTESSTLNSDVLDNEHRSSLLDWLLSITPTALLQASEFSGIIGHGHRNETLLHTNGSTMSSPAIGDHSMCSPESPIDLIANEITALRGDVSDLRAQVTNLQTMLREVTRPLALRREADEFSRNSPSGPGWLTTREAAKKLSISRPRMQQVIADQLVRAVKLGNLWYVDQDSLQDFTPPGTGHRVDKQRVLSRSSS